MSQHCPTSVKHIVFIGVNNEEEVVIAGGDRKEGIDSKEKVILD